MEGPWQSNAINLNCDLSFCCIGYMYLFYSFFWHSFFCFIDARGNPAIELPSSGAYTIIPQFTSPSQTVNIKIGETARLPCEVQNLGKLL